jgi:hypothetical protein
MPNVRLWELHAMSVRSTEESRELDAIEARLEAEYEAKFGKGAA